MRNSSLVEHLCADNVTGLSGIPKLWIYTISIGGRGAFLMLMKEYPRGILEVEEERMQV